MKITTKTVALVAVAVLGATVAWAEPTVSNVNVVQLPAAGIHRKVKITYDLGVEDAIVTLSIETNGIALPDSVVTRLSGDVCKVVQPGTGKSIIWHAGADWPENATTTAKAKVTAWSTNAPPLYCVVDVVGGANAQSYPVYYYVSADAVPGGVTNYIYKTVKILMRKIPPTGAEGFLMGSPDTETGRGGDETWHDVVLTKAFYIGVYEMTQSQWYQVIGNWTSGDWDNIDYRLTRAVTRVSHIQIRENLQNSTIEPNWPQSNAVYPNSFMGKMLSKTGLSGFDLPTEAQWEYACRAGTTGALNDGTVNLSGTTSDARLAQLGRYARNGGKINGTTTPAVGCTTQNATAAVGSYAPNAWGLYDMHGNVWEWCLDWKGTELTGNIDPKGPESGGYRVRRGGAWYDDAKKCRSAERDADNANGINNGIGFRLVRTLP